MDTILINGIEKKLKFIENGYAYLSVKQYKIPKYLGNVFNFRFIEDCSLENLKETFKRSFSNNTLDNAFDLLIGCRQTHNYINYDKYYQSSTYLLKIQKQNYQIICIHNEPKVYAGIKDFIDVLKCNNYNLNLDNHLNLTPQSLNQLIDDFKANYIDEENEEESHELGHLMSWMLRTFGIGQYNKL